MMDISVILVNYNTRDLTKKCIESIKEYVKSVSYEIIVIDNNSVDNSVKFLQSAFQDITLIQNEANIGFGPANNIGASFAKGKYLLFLNTDTILLNDSLSAFYYFYENNQFEKLGAVGGALLNEDLSLGWSAGSFNSLSTMIRWYYLRVISKDRRGMNILGSVIPEDRDQIIVDYVTGADLFIRRDLFLKVGGFDQNIFMYFEDELLQYRLKQLGYKNVIIGGTKIVHLEGASMSKVQGKVPNRKRIISERSMFYYFETTKGYTYKSFAKVVYFILVSLPLRFFYPWSENKEYFKNYLKF